MYWGQGCLVARSLEVLRVSYIIALLDWRQQMMQRMSGRNSSRKDNDQQNLSKMIMWYCIVYNQIASDVSRYNNPVYKLMTNKLQLVLINMLNKSIFEH